MTPIKKNVIVVDEQGNHYESTYPKRAKGLVKNGRARFISENILCLACPPHEELEEMKMENSKLTAKDILTQLTALQNQLTENGQTSLSHISEAAALIGEDENRHERIEEICEALKIRELTFQKMVALYEKMYDDIQNEKAKKIDLINAAFEKNMAFINDSDLASEDKFAALGYVTEKISDLVEQLITADSPL